MLHYITTLNIVKLALKHKQKKIKLTFNKKTTRILNKLILLNIIKGWTIINKYTLNVYVNNLFPKQIKLLVKPSKIFYVKANKLQNITKTLKSASIYLSTSAGILNSTETVDKRRGGYLLFALI